MINEALQYNRKLPLSEVSRRFCRFPSIFLEIPGLKFIVVKLQIYNLIDQQDIKAAQALFQSSFKEVIGLDIFRSTLEYFSRLLCYFENSDLIFKHNRSIVNQFYDHLEAGVNFILNENKMIVFVYAENSVNFIIKDEDLGNCSFLSVEKEIDNELKNILLQQGSSQLSHFKSFESETYILQELKEYDYFYLTEDNFSQICNKDTDYMVNEFYFDSNSSNKIYKKKRREEKIIFNDSFHLIKYLVVGNKVKYVFLEENQLNLNYIKSILSYDKINNLKNNNKVNFNNVNLGFIKKEQLDILIIRRFKKYLKLLFTRKN